MTIMVGGALRRSSAGPALLFGRPWARRSPLQGGLRRRASFANSPTSIAIASGMVSRWRRTLAFARAANQLDLEAALQKHCPAAVPPVGRSSTLAPASSRGDFAPGFYVKHFVKDIGLSLEVCELKLFDCLVCSSPRNFYADVQAAGDGRIAARAGLGAAALFLEVGRHRVLCLGVRRSADSGWGDGRQKA
jgi:hypothetical protein